MVNADHPPDSTLAEGGRPRYAERLDAPTLPSPFPFVGRAGELAELERLLGDPDRKTSVVILSGEGGVGKSRLAATFAESARREGWEVARGRAYPVETGVPYALIADAFLPIIREMDPARLAVLSRGGERELRHLFPALGDGLESEERFGDAAELRTRLLWNFTQFLKSYASRTPLLCVFEDLQWADGSSLELLHFLARQTTGQPVLILCTYNDAERDRSPQLVRTERSLVSLGICAVHRLRPLTLDEVGELLRRAFDVERTVVGEFAALLYGWARGNPFFVEELLKTMVASGRLERRGASWVGWQAAELALPGSVRDAVLARLSSFSAVAQEVAELASVVGARSRHPVLASLAGLDEEALLAALEELVTHRILDERMEDGTVVYVFSHPLVRQALYEELGLQRSRALHGAVARALEDFYGAGAIRHADELAYHYARAGDAAPSGKALGYLAEAGQRAMERRADQEALEYLRSALTLARAESDADDARLVELLGLLARAYQHVGDFESAIALWEERLERLDGSAPDRGGTLRALGMAHFWCGRHDQAHRYLDEGLDWARREGADETAVRLRIAKGHCLHDVGRGQEALEVLRPALPLAEATGDPGLEARVHRSLALLYVWVGPPRDAHTHAARAIELARSAGDLAVEFWARWAGAVMVGMRGGSERMRAAVDDITDLADRTRSPVLQLWAAEMSIELAYGRGEWDAGIALGERAIGVARDLHQRALLPRLLVWTAQFHMGRGDADRARECIDEAVHASGMRDRSRPVDVHQVVPACIGVAHYRVGIGDYAAAIEAAEHGLSIAEGTGYTLWAVHRLLPVLAEACLWAGEIERAETVGTRLRAHAQALDHTLGLAWADACDALVRWKRGDVRDAVGLMRGACDALEGIPMIPYAARIRRQLAGRLIEIGAVDDAVAELERVYETCLLLGAEPELEKTRLMFGEAGRSIPPRGTGAGLAGLTDRETEVALLVAKHLTNAQIGEALGMATRTASTHVSNIYKKLGVGSRGALADLVRGSGLSGPD